MRPIDASRRSHEGRPVGGHKARKSAGLTQAQVAETMGVSQARVSQIEHRKITEMDAVRAYVQTLGGTVDVIAHVGDWTIKVA